MAFNFTILNSFNLKKLTTTRIGGAFFLNSLLYAGKTGKTNEILDDCSMV
jgi:hypothetical protein